MPNLNKIDFALLINVSNANPNGDPLNGNRPRTNYSGQGEITDVCIKRKIRNRLLDAKHQVFVQSDDYKVDTFHSLKERAEPLLRKYSNDPAGFKIAACAKWIDVRAFGQLFAFRKDNEVDAASIGIRGPVSIRSAFSVAPVSVSSLQIVKSVNGETPKKGTKASDTLGMKHRIDHGLYVVYGSINPNLADKTGFSYEDAQTIKKALVNLLQNDESSARPAGSMEVAKVYWWEHNCKNGQYSSARVHRSLKIKLADGVIDPQGFDDYDIKLEELQGLEGKEISQTTDASDIESGDDLNV